MRDSVYLAWQYLRHHRLTTAILVASIALILYLPAALQAIVASAELHLRSRADSTPLVIGPRGSDLELVLNSVYFNAPSDAVMRFEQVNRVEEQRLANVIPIHSKHTARDCIIVGTTQRYFDVRNLRVSQGRAWKLMGECVIGASVAERLEIQPGARIPVSGSATFVLREAPLRLHVVGVLAMTETPDDEAIFTSMETSWIIEGLGHGHAADAKHGSPEAQLYTDITEQNVEHFHFHGSRDQFPMTAMLVFPSDRKSETILLGQYFSPDETVQIVQPKIVIQSLLARVVMVRSYLLAAIMLVSLITLVMMSLVIALSIRLRRSEIATMSKMGCARHTMVSIIGSEIAIILFAGVSIATALTLLTSRYGPDLVHYVAR